MRVAFIGLGRMGLSIAGNLLAAGHELTVFNRTRDKADTLVKAGAKWAVSPAEAATDGEVVFSMLADDDAVESVTFGKDGIADGLSAGAVHVSLSTISIALARKLAEGHETRKQGYISAPVFGRPDAAAAKRLLVVIAGKTSAIEKVKAIVDAMGRQTYIAGSEPWMANLVKLNGNFMIAAMMETFGEAFATMRKAGVDHHLFYEIMTELFGSPVYKNYGAAIADQKFEPALFALKLGFKDIRLGLEAANELQVPTPFAGVLRDHFLTAMAHGQEQWDWSSVGRIPALLAGLETTGLET